VAAAIGGESNGGLAMQWQLILVLGMTAGLGLATAALVASDPQGKSRPAQRAHVHLPPDQLARKRAIRPGGKGTAKLQVLLPKVSGKELVHAQAGFIGVHFIATHEWTLDIVQRFQWVIYATLVEGGEPVAFHEWPPYEMHNGDSREDEFTWVLEVPAGRYQLTIERRSLHPHQHKDGSYSPWWPVEQKRWIVEVTAD
jgi:hypothetical protein